MPRFLQKRRRRWYAILEVPADLRDALGRRRLVKSLETESLTEAERLVLPIIAKWKEQFATIRQGGNGSKLIDLEGWAEGYLAADEEERDILDLALSDLLDDLEFHDPQQAHYVRRVARGQSVQLSTHIDEWLATLNNAPKSIDMKRSDVKRFSDAFKYSDQVDKGQVSRWADRLQREDGLAPGTVRRIVSAVRGYWRFLGREGYINRDDNPFEEAVASKSRQAKASPIDKRQPFEPNDVVRLVNEAASRGDQQLSDLIELGMWTGCRIEELCSLKTSECSEDRLNVRDAKTPAGWREVPVHTKLKPTVSRLIEQSRDGYLLSGLTFNKYGDRSNGIGKRFGRLKRSLGFGKQHVFHSIRKTVVTLLENAGVPENVTADIVGHEKQTITYGLYSGGASFKVKSDAVELLNYPSIEVSDRSTG